MIDSASSSSSKIRVLLVDDSATFLRSAVRFLRVEYDQLEIVGTAMNAEQALLAVQALRPDVILLDINMPDVNGIELIPRIRALLPPVRVVMLTLLERDTHQQDAMHAGANGYVVKDELDQQLMPAIQNAMAAQ